MALIEFYGTECPHCKDMEPLIEKLGDAGHDVERLEVWHDEENAKKMKELDRDRCGGVPLFVNTETDEIICGAVDYEKLKEWAEGGPGNM